MYKIVPEEERTYYTREQLDKKFDGKWLFLTNQEYDEFRRLIRAKVAVISDRRWGGFEDGIYKQFRCYAGERDLLHDSDGWGDEWE